MASTQAQRKSTGSLFASRLFSRSKGSKTSSLGHHGNWSSSSETLTAHAVNQKTLPSNHASPNSSRPTSPTPPPKTENDPASGKNDTSIPQKMSRKAASVNNLKSSNGIEANKAGRNKPSSVDGSVLDVSSESNHSKVTRKAPPTHRAVSDYRASNGASESLEPTGHSTSSSMSDTPTASGPPPLYIAVMGVTGSGKSQFINTASSADCRDVGHTLESCTAKVDVSPSFILDGREVVLVDTPGFDDSTRSDAEILGEISVYLAESYKMQQKLAGIIYLHRISDVRVGGMAVKNFNMFRKLCGDTTLKNVVIVTTRWDDVAGQGTIGEQRERELMTKPNLFQPALAKDAKMLRYHNTFESACDILRVVMSNTPLPLLIQEEMVDDHRKLVDTTAGGEVNQQLEKLMEQHRKDIEELKKMNDADLAEKDAELKRLHEELVKLKQDSQNLALPHASRKEAHDRKMRDELRAAEKTMHDARQELGQDGQGNREQTREKLADAGRRQRRAKRSAQCVIM